MPALPKARQRAHAFTLASPLDTREAGIFQLVCRLLNPQPMNKSLGIWAAAWLIACGPNTIHRDDGAGGMAGQAGSAGSGGSAGNADPGGTGGEGGDAGQGGTASFGLNDVSILFPVPEASGDGLYRATDVGGYGELLPLEVFQAVGPIARKGCPNSGVAGCEKTEPVETTHPRLRVVGVRIDPCFPALGGSNCRSQVRFVMQPVESGGFDDDALHVFYDLPKEDFDALVRELGTISRSVQKDLPLGVHPLLSQQGTNGAYAKSLKAALFSRIGASRISRVTALQMTFIAGGWSFRGFEFDHGSNPTPIGIVGSTEHEQEVTGFGSISPPTPVFPEDSPFSLLWDSERSEQASDADRQAAYDAALTIENPTKKTVDQESCVACHTALPMRIAAEKAFKLNSHENSNAFTSSFNLALTSKPELSEQQNMLHAFSYHGSDAGISQRAVNESAAVAEYLNSPN